MRLFSRYGPAFLPERSRKIAANSSLFRLAPPTSAPPTSGKRQDRARAFGGLDGTAIEDAHRPTLGAQMFDKATSDMRMHLNDFL